MTTALVRVTRPKTKTNHIPPAVWDAACELLVNERVVKTTDLDQLLGPMVDAIPVDEWTGAGRNRRLNLIDHVKAQMVKQGLAVRVEIEMTGYYLYLPTVGAIEGRGLVYSDHVRRVLHELVAKFHRHLLDATR